MNADAPNHTDTCKHMHTHMHTHGMLHTKTTACNYHHHTMQVENRAHVSNEKNPAWQSKTHQQCKQQWVVASWQAMCVHYLVNGLVGIRKHHQRKLQEMLTASASEVFALIDGRKKSTSASCCRSRPSSALLGAGCSNQLQLAQWQGLVRDCALVLPAIVCCILLLLVYKIFLTLCILHVLVVFFCHQIAQKPHFTCSGHHLQIALVVLFLYQLAHLLMCTHDLP